MSTGMDMLRAAAEASPEAVEHEVALQAMTEALREALHPRSKRIQQLVENLHGPLQGEHPLISLLVMHVLHQQMLARMREMPDVPLVDEALAVIARFMLELGEQERR